MLLPSLFLVVATVFAAAGTIAAVVEAAASLVEGRDDPASAYAGFSGEDSAMMDETDADSIPCRSARRFADVGAVVVVGVGVVVVAIFIVAAVVIVVGEYCL